MIFAWAFSLKASATLVFEDEDYLAHLCLRVSIGDGGRASIEPLLSILPTLLVYLVLPAYT